MERRGAARNAGAGSAIGFGGRLIWQSGRAEKSAFSARLRPASRPLTSGLTHSLENLGCPRHVPTAARHLQPSPCLLDSLVESCFCCPFASVKICPAGACATRCAREHTTPLRVAPPAVHTSPRAADSCSRPFIYISASVVTTWLIGLPAQSLRRCASAIPLAKCDSLLGESQGPRLSISVFGRRRLSCQDVRLPGVDRVAELLVGFEMGGQLGHWG